jgi:hypothetical protein
MGTVHGSDAVPESRHRCWGPKRMKSGSWRMEQAGERKMTDLASVSMTLGSEVATSTPHIPARHHYRHLRRVAQERLGTTRPARTALRLRFGPTSPATLYLLPPLIQGRSPLALVELPLCLESVLLRIALVRAATVQIGLLAPHPILRV